MAADIAGIVVLILVSAFFAIAEISIVAARLVKLDVLLEQGEHLASISFALSFLLVTRLFILFADLISMRIGMALPERVAMKVVQPMVICLAMLKPLVRFFDSLSGMILRLLQIPTERVENVTTQDVVAIVDVGTASGSIASHEHRMIGRVFELESHNPMIVPRGNGSWLIDVATAIMDIEQSTGIARFSEPENYETVAGFMMHRLKRLPALTDTVVCDGFTFEVVDMEQLKITKLLLTKNTAS